MKKAADHLCDLLALETSDAFKTADLRGLSRIIADFLYGESA